jgi:hypothetical protein
MARSMTPMVESTGIARRSPLETWSLRLRVGRAAAAGMLDLHQGEQPSDDDQRGDAGHEPPDGLAHAESGPEGATAGDLGNGCSNERKEPGFHAPILRRQRFLVRRRCSEARPAYR